MDHAIWLMHGGDMIISMSDVILVKIWLYKIRIILKGFQKIVESGGM